MVGKKMTLFAKVLSLRRLLRSTSVTFPCNPLGWKSVISTLQRLTTIRTAATIWILLLCLPALAQRSSSTPPSWESLTGAQAQVYYEPLPDTDDADLIAEDFFLNLGKHRAYRFGFSHVTSFNPNQDGRWSVLDNGDRIWLMGLHSKGAQGIGAILENVYIPPRGAVYIYSEDKTEVFGPITHDDNRSTALLQLPPMHGERLVLEYFEPYAERGEGQFTVARVIHNYRNLEQPAMADSLESNCLLDAKCAWGQYRRAAKSVVRITTAEGSKSANGVLINNSGNLEQPYVLTSDAVLEGRASTLLFEFNRYSETCGQEEERSFTQVITGANIVVHNEAAGLVLLSLHESPSHEWNLYYSGWNRDVSGDTQGAVLFHPGPDGLKVAELDQWALTSIEGTPAIRVDRYLDGATSAGALGAPLFNSNGQVIGIFTEGDGDCQDFVYDRFNPISLAWDELDDFLNPVGQDLQAIDGDDVDKRPRDNSIIQDNLALFPNPASGQVFVFNGNDQRLSLVRFYNGAGQLVKEITPEDQAISISDLSPGAYLVEIQLNASVSVMEKLIVH